MFDPATRAPLITRETAADMARRAAASRVARIQREKAEERQRDIEARALAISRETTPDPDDARKAKVLKQIDKYLSEMKDASIEERIAIGKAVKDLWPLTLPTAGVNKPRQSSSRPAPPTPSQIATPQETSASTSQPSI
jgi:aromatic ring hydroxylase